MDVHTLINGMAAELRQLKAEVEIVNQRLDEITKVMNEPTAHEKHPKPEHEMHPKKGSD